MLLGIVVLFGDFLFSGQMLYGSDTVTAGIFHRSFLIDNFKATGQIPQWNPYAYGGMPYVDAFHGDIFYPLSVLKFFLPLYFYLGFNLVLHIFLAGIFMYLAARQFKLEKTASLFAAACYMTAPYLVSMVAPGHDAKIYTAALFPLVMLFLDRAFEMRPFLNFTILGIVLGMIILSPQPETSYFTFWAVGSYTLYKLIRLWLAKKSFKAMLKPGFLTAYAVILALLLAAIQFYPGFVYSTNFTSRISLNDRWKWASSWSMHEEELVSQLIPEFCGTSYPPLPPLDQEPYQSSYWGENSFKDNSDAVGGLAIFLALFWFFYHRKKETWFFALMAFLTLAYAVGDTTPVFKLFYDFVPNVSLIRSPSKILFLFSFSMALLSGMGLQTIIDSNRNESGVNQKLIKILLAGFPLILLTLALLFTFFGREILERWTAAFSSIGTNKYINQGAGKLGLALQNLPDIQKGTWYAFSFSALEAVIICLFRSGKTGLALLSFLFVLPIFDNLRFDKRFVHVVDQANYFQPNELVQFLEKQKGEFRVLTLSQATAKSYLPMFGIEVVQGYHSNQLIWYDDLMGGPGFIYRRNPRFLNLVGGKYVIVPSFAQVRSDYFGNIPSGSVGIFGQDQVLLNNNAFKRVFLVNQYLLIQNHQEIPEIIVKGDDDLSQIVYLEKLPPITIPPDSLGNDSVWFISRALDSAVIGVNCSSNRILVLTENYYDAWQAFIDGNKTEILMAYGSFRAVAVPAGAKEVKFVYKSERYLLGKVITGSVSIYLLLVFGFFIWNNISNRTKKEISRI